MEIDVDALAQEIRRVDGKHSLGAGALAEALAPYIARIERHDYRDPLGHPLVNDVDWLAITSPQADKARGEADPNEGHADACACLHPGDRECNCHKAYGFATAEDMDIADAADAAARREEWMPDVRLHEVACDLPNLFGRASREGHEVGQRIAAEIQAKMREAFAPQVRDEDSTDYECPDCGKLNYKPLRCQNCGHDPEQARPDGGEADMQMPGDVWRNSDGSPTYIDPAPAPDVALEVPYQECYADTDGDTWFDSPDDAEFTQGRKVGDTYEVRVSHYSIQRTYVVTKAPDDTSDDYEVEPFTAAQQAES